MKSRLAATLLALALLAPVASAVIAARPTAARQEIVVIPGPRSISIAVPEGFTFASGRDGAGPITVRLAQAKAPVSLQISFFPDPDGDLATARGRKERMVDAFQQFVATSVEKSMQFEELEPKSGSGTYCVFTDENLVGQTTLPPNEYRQVTAGIKAWSGCFALFTLMSNDTTSPEYIAAMKVLRESVAERFGPFRP
jgi:hypothetical protein